MQDKIMSDHEDINNFFELFKDEKRVELEDEEQDTNFGYGDKLAKTNQNFDPNGLLLMTP